MKRKGCIPPVAATCCCFLIVVMAACGGGGGGSSLGGGTGPQIAPLVINTTSLPSGITGVAYQQTLSASGGTAPYTWSVVGFLPNGLSLSPNGTISGTSTAAVNGSVQFEVTDSSSPPRNAFQSILMNIVWQLTFQTTSISAAHINAPYDAVIQLSANADPTSWKLVSGTLPPGLQLSNPSPQQIEITGATTQMGSFPISLQVQDTSTPPQVATQNFTLTVDNALAIATQRIGSAIANQNYSVTISAVNGTPPYQWSAVGLPSLLTIDPATGTIAGVPIVYGIFQPTVTVSDSAGHTASQTLGLSIIGALNIPNFGNLSAVVNKPFYDNLIAFGGTPPYIWSVVSGALPSGLTLDGVHGIVSGTPTQLGTYPVTFQVTDAGTPQQTARWATPIAVVPPQLYITSTLPAKLPLGVPVAWTAAAGGGTPPYHWSISSGTLPPGLNFDPNTADLTGSPTALGQYPFTLQVTDSGTPPQTASNAFYANVTTPLGRNDTIAHATPVGDGGWQASISPYADPPDNPSPQPDTDHYRIIGAAGSVVKVWTIAKTYYPNTPLDTVLEFVDANGSRLTTCRLPGDTSNNFNSPCMNDDIVDGVSQDSQLEIQIPGSGNSQTTFYAHVLDWRGDARPDMVYYLNVLGSVAPLQASAPNGTTYGTGAAAQSVCPVNVSCSALFTATGGTQPLTWSLASGNLPPGMSLDPTTGSLSGTPAATGTYSMVAQVTDAASPSQTATAAYTLTIETMPTVTTTSLPDAFTGQLYTFTLAATGGTPPYQWSTNTYDYRFVIQTDSQTGTISGIPRAPNVDTLYVSATDAMGLNAFVQLPINIRPGPFQFPNGTLGNGQVGVPYGDSAGYYAVGGLPPYTITLVGGSVPPGLTLTNGGFGGIPTSAGTYVMMLQATDSSTPPQSLTATYTITINP